MLPLAFALDPEPAVHQVRELARDGRAEAHPPALLARRGARLRETVEEGLRSVCQEEGLRSVC